MKNLLSGWNVAIVISALVVLIAVVGVLFSAEDTENSNVFCSMAEASTSNAERFKGENHSAAILGYTGGIGQCLVKQLDELKIFKRVVLIGRREIPLSVGEEFEQKVVDFEKLDEHTDAFKDIDVCLYCMGATISGSGQEQFVKVDRDYLLKIAEISKGQSCKHFSLVSSAYANKNSSSLYMRIKGETEEAVKALNFDRVSIFRPAALLGQKKENFGSRVLKTVLKPVFYVFPTLLSVHREVVAKAMINDVMCPVTEDSKAKIFENKDIHKAAKGC